MAKKTTNEKQTLDLYDRMADALEEIAENSGGDSELPTVTSDDNGDVLTVVEGAWAKAAPSGGVLVVTQGSESPYALNHTWQEIYNAGGAVMYVSGGETDYYVMTVTRMTIEENGYYLYFYNYEIGEPMTFVSNSANGYPAPYVDGNG